MGIVTDLGLRVVQAVDDEHKAELGPEHVQILLLSMAEHDVVEVALLLLLLKPKAVILKYVL